MKIDARAATLVGLLIVVVAAIVWVSHAENEASRLHLPSVLPEPTTVEGIKLTDWISAIGTAIGALLTAGALLIAAFTYRHQVDEKNRVTQDRRDLDARARRAQAAGVSVLTSPSLTQTHSIVMKAYNGSPLPIRDVLLTCVDRQGRVMGQEMKQVVPAGGSAVLERPERVIDRVVVRFTDAEGRVWRSHVNGEFEEA